MRVNQGICKKCNKKLLTDEKKYCRYCADKRENNAIKLAGGIFASVFSLALAVVSLGKINQKK